MRKNCKRLLSFLTTGAMLLSMAPITAFASDDVVGDDWAYSAQTGHYYEFINEPVTYSQALADIEAKNDGGYLACISSVQENSLVNTTAQTAKEDYWIGLFAKAKSQDTGYDWVWGDGSAFTNDNGYVSSFAKEGRAIYVICGNATNWFSDAQTSSHCYVVEYDVCPHNKTEIKNKTYNCIDGGYTGDKFCSACGELLNKGSEKEATGVHNLEPVGAIDANCFVDGQSSSWVCTDCGYESGEQQSVHLEHDFDSKGICSNCGMIKNAALGVKYSADMSNVSFNVVSFTPEKTGEYYFKSTAVNGNRDMAAFLYDDYSKLAADVQTMYKNANVDCTGINEYIESNHDSSSDDIQPKLNYELKEGQTYYFLLAAESGIVVEKTDSFSVSVNCAHSSTSIIPGTADCDKAGISDATKCDVCDEILEGGEYVESYHSPGSRYLESKTECSATCYNPGYTANTVICSRCNNAVSGSITPQLKHNFDEDGVCKNCSQTKINSVSDKKSIVLTPQQPYAVYSYTAPSSGKITVNINGVGVSTTLYRYTSESKLNGELGDFIEHGYTSYSSMKSGEFVLSPSSIVTDNNVSIKIGVTYYYLVIPNSNLSSATNNNGTFALSCAHPSTYSVHPQGKTPVSCTQDGYTDEIRCEVCGEIVTPSEYHSAYGHDIGEFGTAQYVTQGAKKASCKSDGYTGDKYCRFCGEEIEKGAVIPNLHSNPQGSSNAIPMGHEASCYQPEVSGAYLCTICGEVFGTASFNGDKLRHEYVNGVCKNCGNIQSTVLKHKYSVTVEPKDVDQFKTMAFTPKGDGSFTLTVSSSYGSRLYLYDDEEDFSSDCTAQYNGNLADKYIKTSGSSSLTCNLTGGHEYLFVVKTTDSVATAETFNLTLTCNHSKTQTNVTSEAGAASCTNDGMIGSLICTGCGEIVEEGQVVTAQVYHEKYSSHRVDNYKSATCEEEGYTGDIMCNECGKLVAHGTTILPHHEDSEYFVYGGDVIEATCVRPGKTASILCKECGKVISNGQQIPIASSSHKFGDDGYCKLCGVPEDFLKSDENGFFLVSSSTDMVMLAEFLNDSHYQKNINVKLTADIDLSDYTMRHGWSNISFAVGTIDGNGHTISGVNIDNNAGSGALFENLSDATVMDLTVKGDVNVKWNDCAIIAVNADNVIFQGVMVYGSVTSTKTAGGIAALSKDCMFIECINYAEIKSDESTGSAGGITGSAQGTHIDDCLNSGNVSGNTSGGITSSVKDGSSISGSSNTGDVSNTGGSSDGISPNAPEGSIGNECDANHSHDFDADNSTVIPATCLEDGKIVTKCKTCPQIRTEVIPATGHTEVVDSAVPATCTESGLTEGSHCLVCNAVIKAQETVPPTGHTEVIDEAVLATCTQSGLTEGSHCSVCNAVIKAQETVPPTGHTEVIDPAVLATCTQSGLTQGSHCSVCNDIITRQEVIPPTGHTVVIDQAVAPTAATSGLTQGSHCSVCGKVITPQQTVPALGYPAPAPSPSASTPAPSPAASSTSSTTVKVSKPKKVSLKKLTAGKKQLKITWNKKGKAKGYQIEYSTSKKFTKKTTKRVTVSYSAKSKTVKKLKGGKKYYVRIRAYNQIGKTKAYSSWSASKNIKVKK